LRELAAELGFWPATTDEAEILWHWQHNKNADYWPGPVGRLEATDSTSSTYSATEQ
jgi:hypothetical protein